MTSVINYCDGSIGNCECFYLNARNVYNRGSYMSANILSNLLNELGKRDNM